MFTQEVGELYYLSDGVLVMRSRTKLESKWNWRWTGEDWKRQLSDIGRRLKVTLGGYLESILRFLFKKSRIQKKKKK